MMAVAYVAKRDPFRHDTARVRLSNLRVGFDAEQRRGGDVGGSRGGRVVKGNCQASLLAKGLGNLGAHRIDPLFKNSGGRIP